MALRWLRRTKPVPESIRPPMPWSHLTLEAWKASDIRVKFASKLFSSRLGQDMISVLSSTCPIPDISDPQRAAMEAARVRGYQQAIAVLLQMQVPGVTIADLPEATYDTSAEDMMLAENE